MELLQLIDELLMDAVVNAEIRGGPPTLGAAMRHAVFPGGARIRPRLCLAVAMACGETRSATAEAAATAIELLHCASLVHDDLPCFDNAPLRRGLPSVHAQYGERIAILAGGSVHPVIKHSRPPQSGQMVMSMQNTRSSWHSWPSHGDLPMSWGHGQAVVVQGWYVQRHGGVPALAWMTSSGGACG